MKLKSLAVLTLLVFGCSFASATSWTFGFESTGHGLYCNYVQFNNNGFFGPDVIQGDDNLSACGITLGNATIVGFLGVGVPKSARLPVVFSKGAIYADNLYDAFSSYACGCSIFTGYQWIVAQALKASEKKYGWIGMAASPGYTVFGDNYGYLSTSIPGPKTPTHGTTTGKK